MSEKEFQAFKAEKKRKGLLPNDFSSLADEQDRIDMMNPAAIMDRLDEGGMITGPGFKAVEGGNPRARGNKLAITGQG